MNNKYSVQKIFSLEIICPGNVELQLLQPICVNL